MRHSRLALAVVAVFVLLSGCSAGAGTTTTARVGENNSIGNGSVPASDVLRTEVLAAIDDVDSYVARQHATVRQRVDGPNRTTTVNVTVRVNRTSRSLHATRRTSGDSAPMVVDRYVVNKTLYQRSDAFVEKYGSEWIRRDIAGGFARHWKLFDQLWRYRFMLNNASLSPVETATVDGEDVYVLRASVDTVEMNAALREALDLPPRTSQTADTSTNLSVTFWIDAETARPVRVNRTVSGTKTIQGETVAVKRTITTRLTYKNVSISLPKRATTARRVGAA